MAGILRRVPERLRPFVWPVTIAVLAVAVFTTRISDEMVDFGIYRTAAARALHAEPLYQSGDGPGRFTSLPAFAIGMTPLAVLGEEAAKVIWFSLSVGLLVALVRWSVSALPARQLSPTPLTWLTVMFMGKFYAHELMLGQANILLGALLVGALLAAQIDKPVAAGVLIGLGAFVKPYAIILAPWLAVGSGVAGTLAAAAVLVAGLLLPAAFYGWTGNLELLSAWYGAVSGPTAPNLLGADNISFAAMWAKWLGPGQAASVLAATTGTAAIGLAIFVWMRRHTVEEPDYLEFALLMMLIPLLSPQGWDYVLLLATPAVVCLVDRWRLLTLSRRIFLGAALALMGLTLFDVMGRELYARFMAMSIVTVAASALLLMLARLRWRQLA